MSKKVQDFVQQVNKQNFSEAKGSFESAIAEKISAAFENKKIELASQMTEGTEIAEAKKHSHDFEADMFGGLDAKLSRGDTVDLRGLEVDDMNTSSYKRYMDKQLGGAVKNLKTKVDRTGMASLSFEVVDPNKVKSVLQDNGIMESAQLDKYMKKGYGLAEAKHSHDFEVDPLDAFDAKLSRGDTVDLKGLEVDDMNTSSYKKFMEDQLGRAAKNVKTKVDRTGMASLSFEVVDPNKVKSVLQDNGIMD